jgi:hypothetical protein
MIRESLTNKLTFEHRNDEGQQANLRSRKDFNQLKILQPRLKILKNSEKISWGNHISKSGRQRTIGEKTRVEDFQSGDPNISKSLCRDLCTYHQWIRHHIDSLVKGKSFLQLMLKQADKSIGKIPSAPIHNIHKN